MVGCSVLGCKCRSERKNAGITFHSYPSDPEIMAKWLKATGRLNWTPTKYSKMCSEHFSDGSLIRKKKLVMMHAEAVPTKYIHYEGSNGVKVLQEQQRTENNLCWEPNAHPDNVHTSDPNTDFTKQEVKEESLVESEIEYKQYPKIVMVPQESWASSRPQVAVHSAVATPGTSSTWTTHDKDPLATSTTPDKDPWATNTTPDKDPWATNDFAAFGQKVAAELSCMPLEDALDLQAQIRQLILKKLLYILEKSPGDQLQQSDKSTLHTDSNSSTDSAKSGPFIIKTESLDKDSSLNNLDDETIPHKIPVSLVKYTHADYFKK